MLAYHLTEAGLDARAADAWARAGRAALGRSAMREAPASSLLPGGRTAAGNAGLARTTATRARGAWQPSASRSANTSTARPLPKLKPRTERADLLSLELGDREGRFRAARWNLWRVYNVRAEFDSAVAVGDSTLAAEALADGDADHEVQARHALVVVAYIPR